MKNAFRLTVIYIWKEGLIMIMQNDLLQMQMSKQDTFSSGQLLNDLEQHCNQQAADISKKVVVGLVTGLSLFCYLDTIPSTGSYTHYDISEQSVIHEVQHYSYVESINTSLPWLSEFYSIGINIESGEELVPLISEFRQLFSSGEYSVVDDILLNMDLSRLSHTAMIAFVKYTSVARNDLSSWKYATDKVQSYLLNDGMDKARVDRLFKHLT